MKDIKEIQKKKMQDKTIICIVGKAGSGKDTILKSVCNIAKNKVNPIISYTSRPMRQGEINGKDYHFITKGEFLNKIQNNEMIEYTEFNGWFYGTALDCLSEEVPNIGVFNPGGIESLKRYSDLKIYTFYITASPKIRLLRQLNREEEPNVDEVIRRYQADNIDFEICDKYGLKNETIEDFAQIVSLIIRYIDSLGKNK